MSDEKRYRVRIDRRNRVTPEELGLDATQEQEMRIRHHLEISLTEAEYVELEGDKSRMTHDMFNETHDQEGFTIRVFLEDVLAEEMSHSHQEVLVRAFLDAQSGEDNQCREIDRENYLGMDEISLEAAEFLLYCAGGGQPARYANEKLMLRDALERGLKLDDFLKPQEAGVTA